MCWQLGQAGASASFSASPPWTSYLHWEYCILTPKSILLRLMYSLFRSSLPLTRTPLLGASQAECYATVAVSKGCVGDLCNAVAALLS